MTRYELKWESGEFYSRKDIHEGCTVDRRGDHEPVTIGVFPDVETALRELGKYKSEFLEMNNTVYYVAYTEYYVEVAEYDEDGEWIGGGDILTFSPVPDRLKGEEE